MQRFSFSNPSRKFISQCVEAFRAGLYTTESDTTFGSGKYESLEAMIASIRLDSEATEGSISVDPSYSSIIEPILKLTNLMRSMDYRTAIPTPIDLPFRPHTMPNIGVLKRRSDRDLMISPLWSHFSCPIMSLNLGLTFRQS